MNKNKKNAPNSIWRSESVFHQTAFANLVRLNPRVCASALLLSMLMFQPASAQNEFQAQYNGHEPMASGFPAHPTLDPNVRPAESLLQNQFSVGNQPNDVLQQVSHQESPDAILGSAGKMFSSMSSSIKTQWKSGEWKDKFGSYFHNFDAARMIGSLALVLGGYFGLVWVSRHFGGGNGKVPKEVVEVLGQTSFGPKKHLQIVRLGSKLLLLINGPEGTHPIGEITDPQEVEYLASLCSGKKTTSADNVLRIAKAATSQNTSQTVPAAGAALATSPSLSNATAAIAAAAPLVAAAANPALAANPNHLATILQSLNGQSGSAAVFEA